MNDRFQRVMEIFHAVRDLSPTAREKALERECAGDEELLAELRSLLHHHDASPPPTEPPPEAPGERTRLDRLEPEPERDPTTIGPYRVVRRINAGGMGVVYLAVRDGDPLQRLAAVKVLKRGMDTGEVLKRFEQERLMLAALNHPGVARLYEAGETAEGLPYFAMEYVEGQPIDEYCDSHRLRISERLTLFRKVCATLQFVHQNLMVHRDLKPSNILVTPEGEPKVLDFGIAKIVNPGLAPLHRDPTAPDQSFMTKEYASPEQIRGTPITVASDIYSLGVILYELVTGHRPYQIMHRLHAEVERVICEVDPERPSTAASRVEVLGAGDPATGSSTTITPEAVAKLREGRPEKLRRRLAGDIDNIVLMAMRKEPQRRYQSAEQFGEDLRRHLDGLPVIARKDTAAYRLSKFVRRNRAGVVAAAIIVIALAGWGVSEARGRIGVESERDRTRRMLDEVLGLADFFIDDLDDLVRPLAGSLRARRLMAGEAQSCLERLRPDVDDDPELLRTLADAHDKVGDIHGSFLSENLGDSEAATVNFLAARELRRPLLAADPGDRTLRHAVAVNHRRVGVILRKAGNVDAAIVEFDAFVAIERSLVAEDSKTYQRPLAIALADKGAAHKSKGELDATEALYTEAQAIRQKRLRDNAGETQMIRDAAVGDFYLGELHALLGDREMALNKQRASIEQHERLVEIDKDHSVDLRYLALSHYFAAGLLLEMGRPEVAPPHVGEVVRIFEKRAAADSESARAGGQDLAMAREIEGRLKAAQGDHAGAMERLGEATALLVALAEGDPKNVLARRFQAGCIELTGDSKRALGDVRGAQSSYTETIRILAPLAGADPADIDLQLALAHARSALGGALLELGDRAAAVLELERAASAQESILKSSPRHARAREGLELTRERQRR